MEGGNSEKGGFLCIYEGWAGGRLGFRGKPIMIASTVFFA